MNIFAGLQKYATSYEVTNTRDFTSEELSMVKSAKVVASQYGMSCCFFMVDGCQKYIPMSRDSVSPVGTDIDLTKAKILTLEKDGESINRIEY